MGNAFPGLSFGLPVHVAVYPPPVDPFLSG